MLDGIQASPRRRNRLTRNSDTFAEYGITGETTEWLSSHRKPSFDAFQFGSGRHVGSTLPEITQAETTEHGSNL